MDFSRLLAQLRDLWGKLPRPRQLAVIVAAAATVALVAFLTLRPAQESFAVLFSGLAPDDAGRVLEALKAQNVPLRLSSGGTVVEVPEARVHELRIGMAASGL